MSGIPREKKESWPLKIKSGSIVVKVYRTPSGGYDLFTVSYHEGGRRVRKYFSDFSEAKTEAKNAAEKLASGQGIALQIAGKDRDAFVYAKKKLAPFGVELVNVIDEYTEAKKVGVPLLAAAQYYREHHHAVLPAKRVADVVKEFLEAKKADHRSDIYLQDCKNRMDRFSADFKVDLQTIQTRDLDAWLRGLKVSARTRNNFRTILCSLFSFAKTAGYLPKDRATEAELTAKAKTGQTTIEIFTPEEMVKILEKCDSILLPFIVLGGFCGLRSAEILRLKWEAIRWESSQVEVGGKIAKTRNRRMAPLTPVAGAWLNDFKAKKGSVITGVKLYERLRKLAKAADLGEEWRQNALRHSFGTYRLASNKNPSVVAYEMGNSPAIIRSSYDAVVTDAEATKWWSIMPQKH